MKKRAAISPDPTPPCAGSRVPELSKFAAAQEPTDASKVGARLRRWQSSSSLTWAAVGERAGCSARMARSIAAGTRRPSPELAARLLDVIARRR